jgi:hypothetical protein
MILRNDANEKETKDEETNFVRWVVKILRRDSDNPFRAVARFAVCGFWFRPGFAWRGRGNRRWERREGRERGRHGVAGGPEESEGVDHVRAEGAVLFYLMSNAGKVLFKQTQAGFSTAALQLRNCSLFRTVCHPAHQQDRA